MEFNDLSITQDHFRANRERERGGGEIERKRDRHTERQAGRQTDRGTERHLVNGI